MSQKKLEIAWKIYQFDFQKEDEEETWKEDDEDVPTVMQTPFGVFRVDDSMNPFKRFEFWMGQTNFDLNQSIVKKIKSIDGVEVLIVFTRYRFIVAAGSLFDFRDIRVEIERELCGKHQVSALIGEIHNPDIAEHVTTLHKEISCHDYWVIYIFPNGSIEYIHDDKQSRVFLRKRRLLEYAQQISNGILITSEDEHD